MTFKLGGWGLKLFENPDFQLSINYIMMKSTEFLNKIVLLKQNLAENVNKRDLVP